MANKIEVFVITPDASETDKYKFHGQADMVILRCRTGDMGILPGRVACSAILDEGVLRILEEGTERKLVVLGAVYQFEKDTLTVITHKAVLPGEVDAGIVELQTRELGERLSHETDAEAREKLRKELHRCRLMASIR